MRILFALPGLHRYNRGAEIAFISIADELVRAGNSVTLIGSGPPKSKQLYRYIHASSMRRERFERFPSVPLLRQEYAYEELTFVPALLRRYKPKDYDATITCGYPFTNWVLRRPVQGRRRPAHIFVTQNGDWPAYSNDKEYGYFSCDGLVCTNTEFFDRNRDNWLCASIPNGVDAARFYPAFQDRSMFSIPANVPVVLMVSALIDSKRVEDGIRAVSKLPDAFLVVAGDGPLREKIDNTAARILPNRFLRLTLEPEKMAQLYRVANVFLHMSKSESFGNIFLEAMASGLPIVGEDSAHLRNILGEEEYLTDTTNLDGVAAAIEGALSSLPIKAEGRVTRAASFAWPNIALRYQQFIEQVVERHESKIDGISKE